MEFDLHAGMTHGISIEHKVHTADAVGAEIDTQGFEGLEYLIEVGDALVGGGFDWFLEEAPDDGTGSSGTFVAVPEANVLGAIGTTATIQAQAIATDTDKAMRLGSIGKERFQRIQQTETGTAVTAGVVGVSHVLLAPKVKPQADQNT